MLSTFINLGLIILGFGILIFVHELGHFLAARWAGIRTEAFAVGMGPVALAYRKGVGFRLGSTARDVDRLVRGWLTARNEAVNMGDEDARREQVYRAMDDLGLGSTEYSLRVLPIGGFVKMLGQEDANPDATSTLRGSYQNTPIGKRMVVVSAGVVMNLILAVLLFVVAFMAGVRMPAPVVGYVSPDMPAAQAMALNAVDHGIAEPGLKPGDRVVRIDGEPVQTFMDVAVAAAMSRGDRPLEVIVSREIEGQPRSLHFEIIPKKQGGEGLLAFGVGPASSTQLWVKDENGVLARALRETGLADQGLEPGMMLVEADGRKVTTFNALVELARSHADDRLPTRWVRVDERGEPVGQPIEVRLPLEPRFDEFAWKLGNARIVGEYGLLGLTPLVQVQEVTPTSPNREVLRTGDVILRLGGMTGPRMRHIMAAAEKARGVGTLDALVLRDGEMTPLTLTVSREGKIGIAMTEALDVPRVAEPIERFALPARPGEIIQEIDSPVAGLEIYGGSQLASVNGRAIADWSDFRAALLDATRGSLSTGEATRVELSFDLLLAGEPRRTVTVEVTAEHARRLHALGWRPVLGEGAFEPIEETLHADGNPITAVKMGFHRTHMFMLHTYVTIDRLFRGTVGVDQLRGPVGIVHLGATVADRGLMYLVFFLAMISVNLAVINFLPLPIVDGGLFLFLVYEKLKGRPPSIAFQNAATIVGLMIIGTLLVVTLYNDVARLVFG